ncbi:MAG: hypothetical protein K8R23_17540 [Chthoniobacter sp.]|nr:hypothetical protein [Chthoniobacter sp.]
MIAAPSDKLPGPRGEAGWLALWAVLIFAVTLLLNTRHNDFPFFYHPDETAKVEQVLTGEWNFHHPMLLLTTTKAAVVVCGVKAQEQNVVEAGRWVSAGMIAAAVVALSLLAFAWRGWTSALTSGAALVLHHQLFELSHYLKEDSALLMGVAWTFLAAFLFWRKPDAARAALLGAATALAISGKYVGVMMLAVALPVLWRAPAPKGRCGWSFVAALAAVLVLVNLPLLLQPGVFRQSFDREVGLVVHGQGGRRSVPHAQYWSVFRDNSTLVVWLLLLVFLASRWRERRTLSLPEWLVLAFPFAFALILSFSPKSNDRYFLPATAGFTLLAAVGAVDAARLLTRWLPLRGALAATAAVLVAGQLPSWLKYNAAFRTDDNADLIAWVRTELPPNAVLSRDSRARLPDSGSEKAQRRTAPLAQKILGGRFAADHGTIAEQRAKGVTHVAVSESDYGRFFLRNLRPREGAEEDFAKRKAFYAELLRDGERVFSRERGPVLYLHPGLRVYRLPPEDG